MEAPRAQHWVSQDIKDSQTSATKHNLVLIITEESVVPTILPLYTSIIGIYFPLVLHKKNVRVTKIERTDNLNVQNSP
jgi:hypothetical protein